MPYGIRFSSEFKTVYTGADVRFEIRQRPLDNDLSEEEIRLTDPPMSIIHPPRDRYESMLGSGLDVNLWNSLPQGQLAYKDIFVGGELENRVHVIIDGVERFIGYVIPEIYVDQLDSLPKAVKLSATDSLSILKNINYTKPVGLINAFTTIVEVLKFTELSLDIYLWDFLLRATPLMNTIGATLTQTFFDAEGLLKSNGDVNNGYDIISMLLEPFGAFIQQQHRDGKQVWVIDRYRFQNVEKVYETFDFNGASTGSSVQPAVSFDLNKDFRLVTGGTISYAPGYKTMTLTQSLERFNNLITPATALTLLDGPTTAPDVQYDPAYKTWESEIVTPGNFLVDTDNAFTKEDQLFRQFDTDPGNPQVPLGSFSMRGIETTTFMAYGSGVSSPVLTIKLVVDIDPTVVQSLWNSNAAESRNFLALFEIEFFDQFALPGVDGWAVRHNLSDNIVDNVWKFADVTSGDYIRIVEIFEYSDDTVANTSVYSLDNTRITFQVDIDLGQLAGISRFFKLNVRLPLLRQSSLFQDVIVFDSDQVDSFHVVEFSVKFDEPRKANIQEGEINTDYVQRINKTMQFGDIPDYNHRNNFRFSNFFPTSQWSEDGSATTNSLLEKWMLDVMQTYQKARFSMIAPARSMILHPWYLIADAQATLVVYRIHGMNWNIKWEVQTLDLQEFVQDDGLIIAP